MQHHCNLQAGNTLPALSLGHLRRRQFVCKRQHFETLTCYAVCPNEWLEWIPPRALLRKCRIRDFTDRFPYRMGNICEGFYIEVNWCWSWNSKTLATWCKELTHLKRLWCWERLKAGGEGDDRGWDGWMASPIQWTWVWVNSRSWWWTGRPGVLQSMGLQSWTRLSDWTELKDLAFCKIQMPRTMNFLWQLYIARFLSLWGSCVIYSFSKFNYMCLAKNYINLEAERWESGDKKNGDIICRWLLASAWVWMKGLNLLIHFDSVWLPSPCEMT